MGTKRLRAGVCGALKFRFEAAECLGSVVAKRAQPRKTRRYRQTIRPRDLAVPGPNLGVGVRHALFPSDTLLGASLSRAVCFPTPLSAACGCLGLMAGPFRPFPVGIYRVRSLRPVRSLPAGSHSPDVVRTRLQILISRVGTLATGTAPAFGWTLAPRYGSDLLPLRLHSLLQ